MNYSLITTVFNESKSIARFIESINKQSEFPDEFIIVDGGSTDDTINRIKELIDPNINLTIIMDASCNKAYSKGPIAKGRNRAVKEAKFQNILVTDAGCVLDEFWVQHMKNGFKDGAVVVSGNYKALKGNSFQLYISDVFCPKITVVNVKDFLPSSRSLGFTKTIFNEVNGYPETSYTAEDTLFDVNLFNKTDEIVFAENAVVYWELPVDFNEMMLKVYNYGYGEGVQRLFIFKYFIRMSLLIFPFPLLLLCLLKKKKIISYPMYAAQTYGFIKGFFKVRF